MTQLKLMTLAVRMVCTRIGAEWRLKNGTLTVR
jgi:hypothetical protein